jgi:hypothetical protein
MAIDKEAVKGVVILSIISSALLWYYFELGIDTINELDIDTINLPKIFSPVPSLFLFPYLVLILSSQCFLFLSTLSVSLERSTGSFGKDIIIVEEEPEYKLVFFLTCFFSVVLYCFYFETFSTLYTHEYLPFHPVRIIAAWLYFAFSLPIGFTGPYLVHFILFLLIRILIFPAMILGTIYENKQLLEKQNELLEKQNELLITIAENQNKSS